MITHLLRLSLAHSLKPFIFGSVDPKTELLKKDDVFLGERFGIYVHIPFCKTLCDFCPYNKEVYSPEKMSRYISALLKELELYSYIKQDNSSLSSIYFGGGSPALAADYLEEILDRIRLYYGKAERIGIELHPRDITPELLEKLKNIGVNMVSIGIQSFDDRTIESIGRPEVDIDKLFELVGNESFDVVDVDLIFAIPGQDEKTLVDDFTKAVNSGATQISTYPFIRFSYAGKNYPKPSRRKQVKLLKVLTETARKLGFVRTSVWTFAKKDSSRYSSVTRNNVLGFGPSATSLFSKRFIINTFSIDEYCRSIEQGESPRALELLFNKRVRRMYWLFWSSYNMYLSARQYSLLFQDDLNKEFGGVLKYAGFLGLVQKCDDGFLLTEKGSVLFHRVEQIYTHQYIDKTWRIGSRSARPDKIRLF